MSARDRDEGNIRILRTGSHAGKSVGARQEGYNGDPADHSSEDAAGIPACNGGEVFAFAGNFRDKGTSRIAKRLCEHMNLNYNLCCQLEHIADGLPDNVDKQECLYVARSIIPVVKHSHEFEENVLFPLLREKAGNSKNLEKTLDRLQGEHWEDESYASEIHNGLVSFVSDLADSNVESLGYMLRGFFEGMRRHLAFEREHVLPMLHRLDSAT
jgi:hypothetical protein